MREMRGRYPGGPSRRGSGPEGPKEREKVHLPSVGEIENRAAFGTQVLSRKNRRKRVTWGVVFSFLTAAGLGLWLGLDSHRTEEELARELQEETAPYPEVDLNKQADRLINEIWKTEALERIPLPR